MGPGATLARIFSAFFIRAKADCPCKLLADLMDSWGPDGCYRDVTEDDLREAAGWCFTHEQMPYWDEVAGRQRGQTRLHWILDSLGWEAARRRLPFVRGVAERIVRVAIHQARQNAAVHSS